MRKLFLLIILMSAFYYQNSTAQVDILRNSDVAPLLKQAATGQPDLSIYGRKNVSKYVNIAILNKKRKTLTWFTCYGNIYDSTQLTDNEYNCIISKLINPFDFYYNLCLEKISFLEDALSRFRQSGKTALKDTSYNRQVVYNSPEVKSAPSTLQKVMVMEDLLRRQCMQIYLFDSKPRGLLSGKDTFMLRKSLAGKMISKGDTIAFYNTYLLGDVPKIILCKRSPQKMFVYNTQGELADSVPLKYEKYSSLLTARADVFLLYRGWLELQSQQILDARKELSGQLNRKDTGLFIYTKLQRKPNLYPAISSLEKQQNAIESKINGLMMPNRKIVEYMLQDAFPNPLSEIAYLDGLGFAYTTSYVRGKKTYELADHKGNVMAVISDKKKGVDEDTDGTVEFYNPDIVNSSDYYPFGALMPGRTSSSGSQYKYGFNGKEKDNEVKGMGNSLDFGARIYDPRIGRWLSIDAVRAPWQSPYAFVSNSPTNQLDPDGNWQTDGHYWTVYLTSLLLGIPDAQRIAYYTEYPDTKIHGSVAEERYTWAVPFVQQGTHSLTGNWGPKASLKTTQDILNVDITDVKEFGRLLHKLGDTYAHRQLGGKGQLYGGSAFTLDHALSDGSEPDLIKNRMKDGIFEGYVQNLTAVLATKYGQFDTKKINSARSKLMELGKYAEKHNVSLIGIINYEVAATNGEKKFIVHNNKSLIPGNNAEYVKNTKDYLNRKGVKYTTREVYETSKLSMIDGPDVEVKTHIGTEFTIK